jgi:uncharacterized membrane protein
MRRRRPKRGWGATSAGVIAIAAVAMSAGYARFAPCLADDWGTATQFGAVCYSDVAVLYKTRAATFPAVPYRDYIFEYPVGTGAFAYAAAAASAGLREVGIPGSDVSVYFTVSAVLLALCALGAIWWTSRLPGTRRGDVVFLAVGAALLGYVNWDLLPVALTAAAVYEWTRGRPYSCGFLLGLGAASKAYPALLLIPLLLICVRERQPRQFAAVAATAAVTWFTLNAPYIFGSLHAGWSLFYTFSYQRSSALGTGWNLLDHLLPGDWPGSHLDMAVSISLVGCTLALAALALLAPRTPGLGQLSFLMIAAFLLTSKSWSPQYGLWLLPFAVLASLSWGVLVGWPILDLAFYVASMWHVNGQIHGTGPELGLDPYLAVIGAHWLALAALSLLVVRDIARGEVPRLAAATV